MEVVRSIATELRRTPVRDYSLASGNAGIALLFGYLAQAEPDSGHEDAACHCLKRAIDALAKSRAPLSFFSGFSGVGWSILHLKRLLAIPGAYLNADIDRLLASILKENPWREEFDLVSGLVGVGVYALEALPRSSGTALLRRIVNHLEDAAERTSLGNTWRMSARFLNRERRRLNPNGCYDLGLAHGVPGIVAFLAQAAAVTHDDRTKRKAQRLVKGAVSWLLAQKLPARSGSMFPFSVGVKPAEPRDPARLAWCYGDLGIATALLSAGRILNRSDWTAEALKIASHAAKRSFKQSGVRDTGLCHGAAGVAHLFNRLYQTSGAPPLRDAARSWLKRAIRMRVPNERVAGFPARHYTESAGFHWRSDPGLLNGATGVALALLSAATPVRPDWDRALLFSAVDR